MRKILISVTFGLVALLALTAPSFAGNPLLGGSTQGTVVGDKELSQVKGSGYYAQLYSYYGSYYLGYAAIYDNIAQFYNYLGYDGPNNTSTNYYYYAYQNASYATTYLYYAYYYSYYKS
jgi:hypothetical protein